MYTSLNSEFFSPNEPRVRKMFTLSSKGAANKIVPISVLKRFLTSSNQRYAANVSSTTNKSASQTKESTKEKNVESYRPLNEDEIQRIVNLDNIHLTTKTQQKCPQRPPLLRNFFTTTIDREFLTYPQVLEAKEFDAMSAKLAPITNYFSDNRRTPAALRFRDISNNMLKDFQKMKLFGLSVQERFAGSGFFKCEMAWANECEANDIKSFFMLAGHRLAVEAIADHGNGFQHNQYLMDLAKGDVIAAACVPDPLSKCGSITATKGDNEYILNGSVSWVAFSQHANLLLVVANKSEDIKKADEEADYDEEVDYDDPALTFILDANSIGITYEEHSKSFGCDQVPFKTVNFSNVRATKGELLSQVLDERQTSRKLLDSSRLQQSIVNMVQSKLMLNHLIEYVIRARCFGEKLREQHFINEHLAKLAMNVYALESMIYLSHGILDIYDNPKVDLESAATTAFSKDVLKSVSEVALSLFGTSSTVLGDQIEQDVRNAIQLQTLGGCSDALKRYVALKRLQHCVDIFGNNVDEYEDSFLCKWGLGDPIIENIQAKQRLSDFLHPTFEEAADNLEESIRRLQCASEIFLYRYGEDVTSHSTDLTTIGDIAMNTYAMFASVGRASRSYCLGIRYGQYELVQNCN